jgi:hypothetical protein
MWALIKDNKIEEIIRFPKTMVINDVTHSRRIFTAWTWDELNAIGIYTVEAGTQGDDRFEITSSPTYTFDSSNNKVTTAYTTTDKALADSNAVDADGNNILDADGNQVINYGLKTIAKNKAKTTAHGLIKRFGWLVQRVTMDSSATIPSAVTTYCAAIRTDCAAIITAIDGASNMTAFKALYVDTVDSDGEVTEVNRINRWTTDSTVEDYIR